MEEAAEVMRAGMVGETTQSRWKARAAADAAGGSGVVVYDGPSVRPGSSYRLEKGSKRVLYWSLWIILKGFSPDLIN